MNILFTSVGRRGYLLDYFREALAGRGQIHASNSSEYASAFLKADKTVISPLIYSPTYVDFMLDYCMKEKIGAVIPLFDLDVPILSAAKERFEQAGVRLITLPVDKAIICNDKVKTCELLKANGFNTPETYSTLKAALDALEEKKIHYPLIIKPRWGMGSIGVQIAENLDELRVLFKIVHRTVSDSYLKYESAVDQERMVIIQAKVIGQEYGLDVINDLDGNYVTTFVKKKLAMRSGETDISRIENDEELIKIGAKLGRIIGHSGNLDVDVFKSEKQIYILELNARFGGGYPFTHAAGVNLPKAIVSWLMGEHVDPEWFKIKNNILAYKEINMVIGT